MRYRTLGKDLKVSAVGLGCMGMSHAYGEPMEKTEAVRMIQEAADLGYTLFDTAEVYGTSENPHENEELVGAALKSRRDKVVIATKFGIHFDMSSPEVNKPLVPDSRPETIRASVEASLKRLNTDHIDLALIHQPFNDYYGTYRAMEEAYKEGWIRAIGVSNFYPDRFVDLCNFVEIKPAVDQVETHVFQQQREAHKYMKKYGIQHESWGPFAEGRNDFFTNAVLTEIGKKYGKSPAQTALRFLIQSDVVVIPKSTHKERMIQNIDVFDFELDEKDMQMIRGLDEEKSLFFSHYDPAIVEMMVSLHR